MPLPSRSLSAAFDTNDHDILITRLSSWFGIHGSVLSWFNLYLSSHWFRVKCETDLSSWTHPPVVSPKALFSVLSFTQLPYRILLFPKLSPVRRWDSAVPFLHSDSLQLQYRSPSKVSQLEFPPGWLELPDNIFNWVNDFLHCTRYAGYSSSVADITASIIQGSSLGPASYSIMAADLHPVTNGNELLSSPTTRT